MTPEDFINAVSPAAVLGMQKYSIPASFTIAEGALESGWGAHAPGYNLFGIKADSSWHGAITIQRTREFIDGKPEIFEARFRAYSNWQGSIDDHATFLTQNPRYKPAFKHSDYMGFTEAVANAGYATDPQYAAKIIAIIEAHNLQRFDS